MRAVRNSSLKNKKADMAFFIYFTVMALFFTKTYIQLAAQLGIIAFVVYDVFTKRGVQAKRAGFRNVSFLLIWFGLLTLWAFSSTQWAYSVKVNSNTLLTFFRILMIGIALFLYVSDYDKAIAVMKSFVYSNVVMAIAALITTPISQYGKAGEDGFGNAIGQQRNTFGAVMTFLVLICIVLYQYEYFRYGKHLAAFFVFSLLCSGSRGAMLQLVIISCLYVLTMPGIVKKFKYIIGAVMVAVVAMIILQNVPYLYETVWVRFENLIRTVLGFEVEADSSAQGRELYKVLAFEMFQKKPWLGFGVDGFYCYLRDIEFVGGYYLAPVYSHCNFTELASCFGIFGLAFWYIPVFSVVSGSFKMRKKLPVMNMIFIVLTSMVILDYARIPWSNHINMYTYFCIILLYFTLKQKIIRNRYQSEFGSL